MVTEYLTTISQLMGMPIWTFISLLLWETTWKLIALWKSARKGSLIWFIILAISNTMGILPILYIFAFSKMKCCEIKSKKNSKKKITKKRK